MDKSQQKGQFIKKTVLMVKIFYGGVRNFRTCTEGKCVFRSAGNRPLDSILITFIKYGLLACIYIPSYGLGQ